MHAKVLRQGAGWHVGGTATVDGTQKARDIENTGEMWKVTLGPDRENP